MAPSSATGHIVWHDLLTSDVGRARQFYEKLLGWSYEVEHAADFVWKSGEADYPLILHDGEAHGGFIEIAPDQQSQWLSFVAVDDVDGAARRSTKLDGTIEKAPFDIPGVGRSAVVHDPQGAAICPFVASHNYPAPTGVFIWDELLANNIEAASAFYEGLFNWSAVRSSAGDTGLYTRFEASDGGPPVAGSRAMPQRPDAPVQWIPYVGVGDVDASAEKARSLGAQMISEPQTSESIGRFALLRDPTGALFGLLKPAI